MSAAAHPHLLLEREAALASITSDLHHMIAFARHAEYYNRIHSLGLNLPTERSLIDLIGQCARLHQEKTA